MTKEIFYSNPLDKEATLSRLRLSIQNLGINDSYKPEGSHLSGHMVPQDIITRLGINSNGVLNDDKLQDFADSVLFAHLTDDIVDGNLGRKIADSLFQSFEEIDFTNPDNIASLYDLFIDNISIYWDDISSIKLTEITGKFEKLASEFGEVNLYAYKYSVVKGFMAGLMQKATKGEQQKFYKNAYIDILIAQELYVDESKKTRGKEELQMMRDYLDGIPDLVLITGSTGVQNTFYACFKTLSKEDFIAIEAYDPIIGLLANFMNAKEEGDSVEFSDRITINEVEEVTLGVEKFFSRSMGLINSYCSSDLLKVKQAQLIAGLAFVLKEDENNLLNIKTVFKNNSYSGVLIAYLPLLLSHLRSTSYGLYKLLSHLRA